jgi:hypothetical protein
MTLLRRMIRLLWSWRPRPPSRASDNELLGAIREEVDELQKKNADLDGKVKGMGIVERRHRAEVKALTKKTLPGFEMTDGGWTLIRVSVVMAWLFIACMATMTLLVIVFLNREVPNFTLITQALGIVGFAAAPIIAAASKSGTIKKLTNRDEED